MSILNRIGLATRAEVEEARARADRSEATLETVRRTNASVRKSRDRAWTFILAAKREGLLPAGAWTRRANSFTASESEGDIQRDIEAADAVRSSLAAEASR